MGGRIGKLPWQVILVLALITGLVLGCGRKGPPRPPHLSEPPVVKDLRADTVGDRLRLIWSLAGRNELPPSGLEGFSIYKSRVALSEADCRGCPVLFERVARVPFSLVSPDGAGRRTFDFRDTLEKGYRYRYKVTVNLIGGRTGGDSNVIELNH